MIYLTLVLISVALLAGFLALTVREAKTGRRMFSAARERLDREAARVFFIVAHVDLAAFLRDVTGQAGKRIAHDAAHISLIIVRFVERLLTRAVRALRAHQGQVQTTQTSTSPFVRSMSDLKQKLRNGTDATSPSEE